MAIPSYLKTPGDIFAELVNNDWLPSQWLAIQASLVRGTLKACCTTDFLVANGPNCFDSALVLDHLRSGAHHYRCCWVVHLLRDEVRSLEVQNV